MEGLLERGLLASEQIALDMALGSFALQTFDVFAGAASSAATGAAGGFAALPGAGAGALSAGSGYFGMLAGLERREEEWEAELEQGRWSAEIAQQSAAQAFGRLDLALGRQDLARLARDADVSAVRFLDGAFLNKAMWRWLVQAVRRQYRTRLNYAIAVGYLAESSLGFELQDDSPRIIRFDYFDPRRDGLFGATALQTDLATLENRRLAAEKAPAPAVADDLARPARTGRVRGFPLWRRRDGRRTAPIPDPPDLVPTPTSRDTTCAKSRASACPGCASTTAGGHSRDAAGTGISRMCARPRLASRRGRCERTPRRSRCRHRGMPPASSS